MAFFPRSIMPLTPKERSPLAGRGNLTAARYNNHDQEIRAIEEFIGSSDLYALGGATGISSGVLGAVNSVISKLNALVDPAGGIAVSSGMVRSGNRIVFPEPCTATFLLTQPAASDPSITVSSTAGFPDQGIISILNDMQSSTQEIGFTNVEWIRYSSKTAQSFEGCERGYGGSFAGLHGSSPTNVISSDTNLLDYPGDIDHDPAVHASIALDFADDRSRFTRHFPAWRRKDIYAILGLYGTMTDVTWKVQRRAAYFKVYQSDSGFSTFSQVTGALGLLRQRDDGSYYLESNDLNYALQGVLTWEEANSVATGLYEAVRGVAQQYWPPYSIPVFYGRMSLTLSIAGVSREVDSIDGLRLGQAATGDVYVFDSQAFVPTYGDVYYHAMIIGSQIEQSKMDSQPSTNGEEEPSGPAGGTTPTTKSPSGFIGAIMSADKRWWPFWLFGWFYCSRNTKNEGGGG